MSNAFKIVIDNFPKTCYYQFENKLGRKLTEMADHIEGVETESANDLLTIEEAIKFMDTSKSTLYRLLSQDEIKGVKVGKQWRFRKVDLIAYTERSPVAFAVDAKARKDIESELSFFDEELKTAGERQNTKLAAYEEQSSEEKIDALMNRILVLAIACGASDLHISPTKSSLRLRYRIDGVLQEIRRLPISLHDPLIALLKEMSEMNFMEKRLPQDGRISVQFNLRDYDLRVSLLPTIYGENAVIRILDQNSVRLGLEHLGMSEHQLQTVRGWILRRSGMIIATGPTGSGKTALLYSCLQEANSDERNALTVEDPVELQLADVTQVQVNRRAGLTYAAALRSFLRQDPDVILCSEMRDLETAEISIETALTGHLLLSALHTEDAPGAVLRLADIGIVRFLVASTLNGVIAVRLARKLCPHCKSIADQEESLELLAKVRKMTQRGGYVIPTGAVFYSPVGCEKCRHTGYKGRIGLFEVLNCNPLLVSKLYECASNEEMEQLAVQSGMHTLLADGMRKAAEGTTSIEEILRATGTTV